jgi:hypothetical protein
MTYGDEKLEACARATARRGRGTTPPLVFQLFKIIISKLNIPKIIIGTKVY